jgi:glucose-1-phosphate thymidylyltransferase
LKCLILAGGFGRRVYPIIGDKPKALLEYLDKPLINHLLDIIPSRLDIFVSINQKFEPNFRRWHDTINRPIELLIESSLNEEQKMGALSSISHWVRTKHIDEDLIVIAADNYFGFDLSKFIAAYNGKNTLVAVHDITDINKATSYGTVRLNGQRIIKFVEKPTHPDSTLIATACYIFPPSALRFCENYCHLGKRDFLGSFIAYLVETDDVYSYYFTEKWFDIGDEIRKTQLS